MRLKSPLVASVVTSSRVFSSLISDFLDISSKIKRHVFNPATNVVKMAILKRSLRKNRERMRLISHMTVKISQRLIKAVDRKVCRCSKYRTGTREIAETQAKVAAVIAFSEFLPGIVLQKARLAHSMATRATAAAWAHRCVSTD